MNVGECRARTRDRGPTDTLVIRTILIRASLRLKSLIGLVQLKVGSSEDFACEGKIEKKETLEESELKN